MWSWELCMFFLWSRGYCKEYPTSQLRVCPVLKLRQWEIYRSIWSESLFDSPLRGHRYSTQSACRRTDPKWYSRFQDNSVELGWCAELCVFFLSRGDIFHTCEGGLLCMPRLSRGESLKNEHKSCFPCLSRGNLLAYISSSNHGNSGCWIARKSYLLNEVKFDYFSGSAVCLEVFRRQLHKHVVFRFTVFMKN